MDEQVKKLTPGRIRELRECHNAVFDELLDVLEAQTEEYQAWITELDGPTLADLKARIKALEGNLHVAITEARAAKDRAASADVFVLRVEGGLPGEIDVQPADDPHSHYYVPSSTVVDRAAVLREVLDAIPQDLCMRRGCNEPTCALTRVNAAISSLLEKKAGA